MNCQLNRTCAAVLGFESKRVTEELSQSLLKAVSEIETEEPNYLNEISEIDFQLISTPGGKLHSILSFLFTEKINDEVFFEVINDSRIEYFEALAVGENWKA